MAQALLELTPAGLYAPHGDFYIDPWLPVPRAVLTHLHADHVCWGCGQYLVHADSLRLARLILGDEARIDALQSGEDVDVSQVRVSLHPAGHILGSAQIRLEHQGRVWVVSGDYKLESDPTCAPHETLECHTFVTESTFALPIFRWEPSTQVFDQIHAWWRANQSAGKASVLYGYALGKAQRLLAGLDPSVGPICTHGAVERITAVYRENGVCLPATHYVGTAPAGLDWSQSLILAPPSAHGTPWLRRFGRISTALASGWMRIRGTRRRKALDRGFALSDHADWQGLLQRIADSRAEMVWVTHGYAPILAQYLRSEGVNARSLDTPFRGEAPDDDAAGAGDPVVKSDLTDAVDGSLE